MFILGMAGNCCYFQKWPQLSQTAILRSCAALTLAESQTADPILYLGTDIHVQSVLGRSAVRLCNICQCPSTNEVAETFAPENAVHYKRGSSRASFHTQGVLQKWRVCISL